MSDLEEKVKNLLASPEGMDQVLSMAKSLGLGNLSKSEPEMNAEAEEGISSVAVEEVPQAAGLFDTFDPKQLTMMMDLLQDYQDESDRRFHVLHVMSEYVKPEDRTHIDKAMRLVKLSKVAKRALHGMRGGDTHV